MFSKLRENYKLSNVLVRIAFVLTFLFANWQQFLGTASNITAYFPYELPTSARLLVAISAALLFGVILMFILPFVINVFLNAMRNYNIPRAEYNLLVYAFFSIGNLTLGILQLVNLFTPILLVWGGVIFPFAVFVICAFFFYRLTVKLYFNDVTEIYYFRAIIVEYAFLAVILGVIL